MKEICMAAVRGDEEFLKEARATDVEATVAAYSDADLLELTTNGDSIVHVAARNGHLGFVTAALECFSSAQTKLICGANNDGDTPLHLAATHHTSAIAKHLVTSSSLEFKAWKFKNKKGNTPLHVALMNGGKSIQVAAYLLQIGPEVASFVNHRKETPLHVAVDYDNQGAKISMKNVINKLNSLGALLDYTKCPFGEDSFSVIQLLLETTPTACCVRDEDGMTPLHRATLNQHLSAVEAIISCFPESVEMTDRRGRTVLHYCTKWANMSQLLTMPGISTLIDQQDEDGNTPLHIAIINSNFSMVKALIEFNANSAIKNKEGISPATLILSDSNSFLEKMKEHIRESHDEIVEHMPKKIMEAVRSGRWDDLLHKLQAEDDSESSRHFAHRDSRLKLGGNIIHEAVRRCGFDTHGKYIEWSSIDDDDEGSSYSSPQEKFIVEAMKKFPILLCQTDSRGCTPLHYAMNRTMLKPGGRGFHAVVDHLTELKHQPPPSCFPLPPWEAQDKDGNNLLHMALMYRRYKFAIKLIEIDSKLVGKVNNHKDTPLHILCRGRLLRELSIELELVDLLVTKDATIVNSDDADGLTPLLRAVSSGRLGIATRILDQCPQSIYQHDSKYGRGVFHLMDLEPKNDRDIKFSKSLPAEEDLWMEQDCKGNTPLHLAIEQQRFGTAQILMGVHSSYFLMYEILSNDGNSVYDMIVKAQELPREFENFLSTTQQWDRISKIKVARRSIYGVRHSQVKEYMSTIGVLAALLAAISFTGAFTVPGGYEQDKGTPIMAKKAAFQVFMVTDVVAMCSSMMVLFCLLWILNPSHVKLKESLLVDLSIGLIKLSFYATLIAFMTGVYITTLPDVRLLEDIIYFLTCHSFGS